MNYNYKYRIYPSQAQREALEKTLEICRCLYNELLTKMKNRDSIPTEREVQKQIRERRNTPESDLQSVYSRVVQMVIHQLYNNMRLYSSKSVYSASSLRYKGVGWYKTFTYHQSGYKLITTDSIYDSIRLSGIGTIPINYHRDIPDGADIKQVSVKKVSSNEWYVVIGIETPEDSNQSTTTVNNSITISPTVAIFGRDSDGRKIELPDITDLYRKLKSRKTKLSRKDPMSNNYQSAKDSVAEIKSDIYNRRMDFLHKLANYYVSQYDRIEIDKRYIGLLLNEWYRFAELLEYKAERAGIPYQEINSTESEIVCEDCNTKSNENLWMRYNSCPSCRSSHSDIGWDSADVKSVDTITSVDDIPVSTCEVNEPESDSSQSPITSIFET